MMKNRSLVQLRRTGKYFFDLVGTERIRRNILQALPFWMASLITGLVAAGYTKMFAYSESVFQNVLHWHSWLIFIVTPVCFFLAWLTIQLFAVNARGSGIPQVMAAIELSTPKYESKIDKLLSFRIVLTKIASSLLMVLGGGAIGREGPTIQIAGSIFRIVNKWIPQSWPKLSRQSFILTGAAAGLAAAFNTPLGGVVFAMEELAKIQPAKAELVKLRYFAGLTSAEAASILNISTATADRYWRYARAWLAEAMRDSG